MTFQPVIPLGGLAGWEFLKRTRDRQEQSFVASPIVTQATGSFGGAFSKIRSAAELVENRQALKVVLGAFGLQDDLDNRAFIGKVISDGTGQPAALANRLADKRYLSLARELAHLAPGGGGTAPPGLADSLISRFQAREFEIAVGDSQENMRFALAYARKMPEIAEGRRSDAAQWFEILGDPPTRRVIETALGLPSEFAALDIDQQIVRLKAAAGTKLGVKKAADFAAPDMIETVTKRFLLMDQLRQTQSAMSGAAVALTLLSQTRVF